MTAMTSPTIAQGTWKADPVHSSIGFEVEHLGVSTFHGRFREFEATLVRSDEGWRISGAARVESVDVPDAQLQAHLLSPEFFDAARAPEIRFEAARVTGDGDAVVAAGELAMRGETRPVEARGRLGEPGVDLHGDERVALELEATVDRREFGVGGDMQLPNGRDVVGREVRLVARLELVKET